MSEIIKLTPAEAQKRGHEGWVLRLVDKNQKANKELKERDYEVIGKW